MYVRLLGTLQVFLSAYGSDADEIIKALLAAEDHRGSTHTGIDWISICRGMLHLPYTGRVRGISTVEQQYARVVFKRRGNLLLNKLTEIVIANRVARRVQKRADPGWDTFGARITATT